MENTKIQVATSETNVHLLLAAGALFGLMIAALTGRSVAQLVLVCFPSLHDRVVLGLLGEPRQIGGLEGGVIGVLALRTDVAALRLGIHGWRLGIHDAAKCSQRLAFVGVRIVRGSTFHSCAVICSICFEAFCKIPSRSFLTLRV